MMRLSTMWRVDRTVAADGTGSIATELARPWSPDEEPVFVRSSDNFVYAFRRAGARHFLRFRPVAASSGHIREELVYMAMCRAAGIRVPVAAPTDDGRLVHRATVAGLPFDAVALSELAGHERDDVDEVGAAAWGALVARLQAIGPHAGAPGGELRQSDFDGHGSAVRTEFDILDAKTRTWPRGPEDFGLVHGDVELDNLRWIGNEVGVLDFGSCGRTWFAMDVAAALSDTADTPAVVEPFLHGYESAGGAAVRERLPIARRWLDLRTYLTVSRVIDLTPGGEHPSWLHDLHARLRDRQQRYIARLS